MGCRITFSRKPGRARGFTLIEVLFATLIVMLMLLTLAGFTMFTSLSFASLYNYIELDDRNRVAIDQITRDVRQANRVTDFTETRLVLEDSELVAITYEYNAGTHELARTRSGASKVLLTECDWLKFKIGQRNLIGGTYDVFETATPATAKVVNVSWVCSRKIRGNKVNTESVQTARIVIRKQGT